MNKLINLLEILDSVFKTVAVSLFAALFIINSICSMLLMIYIAAQNPDTILFTNSIIVVRIISLFLIFMAMSVALSLIFHNVRILLINQLGDNIIKKLKC